MNRRSFLRLFGAGLPAVVVAEKVGLIDKARKYFFAPRGGWARQSLSEEVKSFLGRNWDVDSDGLLSRRGVTDFPCYDHDGRIANYTERYYYRKGRVHRAFRIPYLNSTYHPGDDFDKVGILAGPYSDSSG